MINKFIAYAYATLVVIFSVFLVRQEMRFPSLFRHGHIELGPLIIAASLLGVIIFLIYQVVRAHWELSKLSPVKKGLQKNLVMFSCINVGLSLFIIQSQYSCRDFGCIIVPMTAVVLGVTFFITLVLSIVIHSRIKNMDFVR